MRSKRWKRLAPFAALAVVSVTSWLVIVPSSSAGEGGGAALDGGYLFVHFGGGTDAYFLWDPDGDVTTTDGQKFESISAGTTQCVAVVGNGPDDDDLVSVSATGTGAFTRGLENPNNVGIIGMGVNSARENSQDCGRISQSKSESLTISLAGDLAGYVIDRAELDMDAKYSATFRTTLSGVGEPVVIDTPTTASGDSGADATSKDNYALPIEGYFFDTIKIESVTSTQRFAAVTLEGGRVGDPRVTDGLRDTLDTYDTVFHLLNIDGVLGCGDDVTEDGVTVIHYEGEGCVPVPYRLTREGDSVTFLQPLNGQRFQITVDAWDPEPATNDIQVTLVDTPAPDHELLWCGGTVAAPTLPGDEVTCRVSLESHIVGTPPGGDPQVQYMQVTEVIYLEGDINYRR